MPEETAVVSVRPEAAPVEGGPDADALRAVQAWIVLNRCVLVDFRNGELDGIELAQRLRRV
jgi:CheY-like chemotaxis protein